MPMTEQEGKKTVEICLRHMQILALAKMADQLYKEVGQHSENDSVKQTLRMLADGSRELLVMKAVDAFNAPVKPWYLRLWDMRPWA
jgi:hypothetical protein